LDTGPYLARYSEIFKKPNFQVVEVHVHLENAAAFPGGIGNRMITFGTIFRSPPTPRAIRLGEFSGKYCVFSENPYWLWPLNVSGARRLRGKSPSACRAPGYQGRYRCSVLKPVSSPDPVNLLSLCFGYRSPLLQRDCNRCNVTEVLKKKLPTSRWFRVGNAWSGTLSWVFRRGAR